MCQSANELNSLTKIIYILPTQKPVSIGGEVGSLVPRLVPLDEPGNEAREQKVGQTAELVHDRG